MAYTAEINRANKSCIYLVLDQSYSQGGPFGGEPGKIKSEITADALNKLLYELIFACTKDRSGIPWDYYDMGILGYGDKVGSAFQGNLSGRELVAISEVAQNPLRVEKRTLKSNNGAGDSVDEEIKFPVWVEPVADGSTPMCQALEQVYHILNSWVNQHPDSFPPVVINITDGEATDGDPIPFAKKIQSLSTNDGNVLVYNLHLSSNMASPVLFPNDRDSLPDNFACQLFEMSSELPPYTRELAAKEGYNLDNNARGFVFNASIVATIKFLQIGTKVKGLC